MWETSLCAVIIHLLYVKDKMLLVYLHNLFGASDRETFLCWFLAVIIHLLIVKDGMLLVHLHQSSFWCKWCGDMFWSILGCNYSSSFLSKCCVISLGRFLAVIIHLLNVKDGMLLVSGPSSSSFLVQVMGGSLCWFLAVNIHLLNGKDGMLLVHLHHLFGASDTGTSFRLILGCNYSSS